MFTVYILHNSLTSKHYIGSTNDYLRRISEHNRGQTKSTRKKGEWILVHKEIFSTSQQAERREKQIKSYKGGNAFKKLIGTLKE